MALSSLSRLSSRLRFLVIAIIGAYAAINLVLAMLAPFTAGWPIFGVTALAVPPMVLAMVYGACRPWCSRWFMG